MMQSRRKEYNDKCFLMENNLEHQHNFQSNEFHSEICLVPVSRFCLLHGRADVVHVEGNMRSSIVKFECNQVALMSKPNQTSSKTEGKQQVKDHRLTQNEIKF